MLQSECAVQLVEFQKQQQYRRHHLKRRAHYRSYSPTVCYTLHILVLITLSSSPLCTQFFTTLSSSLSL